MKNVITAWSFAICLGLAGAAGHASGAQDSSGQTTRATLRGWEEGVRLAIVDRGGSFSGRTSERGILQRFNEAMDSEYDLDVISSSFSLIEVSEWYDRDAGARYWAGSIDHLRLIQRGDIKSKVSLGSSWAADVQFTIDETLRTQRSLIRLGFSRKLAAGRSAAFALGTLKALKPEVDIEVGFTWAPPGGEVTFALAALDLFSNIVYKGLGVSPALADSALDYTALPFTARLALDLPVGRRWRLEGYGLHLFPARFVIESQTRPQDGFSQNERYDYAGFLIEFHPSTNSALGAFATAVRAEIDRSPLAAGRPEDDFGLTEATSQLGLYTVHHLTRRFALEGWTARVWRTEDRARPDTSVAPNIDYEDRTWAGRWSMIYRAAGGFRVEPGLDFTARTTNGPEPVDTLEPLDRQNFRLRADLGWHFGRRAYVVVGANLDLDTGKFDGAHGRFWLTW